VFIVHFCFVLSPSFFFAPFFLFFFLFFPLFSLLSFFPSFPCYCLTLVFWCFVFRCFTLLLHVLSFTLHLVDACSILCVLPCYCLLPPSCFTLLLLNASLTFHLTTTYFLTLHLLLPIMLQPHFEASVRMKLTLPKVGTWSPPGLPQLQSSTTEGKTPCLEVFFILLERPWNVDVENGLAWAIWTSIAQVMVKRRAGSKTGSLIPDHKKSGINPIPVCADQVQHTVGKLLRWATSLL